MHFNLNAKLKIIIIMILTVVFRVLLNAYLIFNTYTGPEETVQMIWKIKVCISEVSLDIILLSMRNEVIFGQLMTASSSFVTLLSRTL